MTGQTRRSIAYRGRDVDYDRPHHIYCALDTFGHLLYVGCSLNVENRLSAHRSSSVWYPFAETFGITGAFDRRTALDREREAIDTEAPYFNSSFADMNRTQANMHAARKRLWNRGHYSPRLQFDDDREPIECDDHRRRQDAWDAIHVLERKRLKESGAYPYITAAERLARYLAAREDAALAAQGRAA